MEKQESRIKHFLSFLNFIIFLLFSCFLIKITQVFIKNLKLQEGFKLWVFFLGLSSPLIFYTFVANLNNIYDKIQRFFFRHTFLYLAIPSLLIVLWLGYFILPKVLEKDFNKDIFVFLGGTIFMAHLIFVASGSRGNNLFSFFNYLFILSLLYTLNLILLGVYFNIGFNLPLLNILTDGIKAGGMLVRSIWVEIFS
ncbi:MAG: hypothetical protein NC904_08835 [Candidatus Omnitrophica bacterium]|nr:hypothetical protein [Candidatus Omnitrophota bacterium]